MNKNNPMLLRLMALDLETRRLDNGQLEVISSISLMVKTIIHIT